MEDNNSDQRPFNRAEINLIKQLREHPELQERFQAILALANATDGPLKTADQIEDMLVEEVRKLGNATMQEWAAKAQQRLTTKLKTQDPSIRSRKKKR
jgi:hypothetical protein